MLRNQKQIKVLKRMGDMAADWLFPPRCPVCDRLTDEGEKRIHKACAVKLFPVRNPVCMKCGRPVLAGEGEYCRMCRRRQHTFVQAKGLFLYRGSIKNSMYRLKYQNRREYVGFYASYAKIRYGEWIRQMQIDCIVPVPMYRTKRRIRGYNQAENFARALGRETGLPVETALVSRIADTRALKLMNESQRRKILNSAFAADAAIIQAKGYRRILLADDIFTTGSTVDSIAQEILSVVPQAQVFVLTICTPAGDGV